MPANNLEEKLAFLHEPASYPKPTQRVETKETHMSWVFLTDREVWKLKKPVRYDYLDFSTLEARRENCEEEVRLNRRLAPDVYYGVVPLVRNARGELRLGGEGTVLDWLVWMRRLPAERMLDQAMREQAVSQAQARQVGVLLARFYRQLPPVFLATSEYRQRLAAELRADQRELAAPESALPQALLKALVEAQLQFLAQETAWLDERVRAGRIIEGHGDLRPEHICLEREPVIIDCLEFNRDFRILDAASELAFLALECARLGAPEIGAIIWQTYCEETGDSLPERLLAFYKSYHACLRAKIAVWHLRDHEPGDWEKWTGKAKCYLQLAASFLALH
jgi:uncharacterized protein